MRTTTVLALLMGLSFLAVAVSLGGLFVLLMDQIGRGV